MKTKLYRDRLATYTTYFSEADAGRANNIRQAGKKIDGTVLLPGESFSYNGVVGERTVANGFALAHVYVGDQVESGLGGGICQVSSTLYSAALYANLAIVERHNHSLPVSYVPGGQDATVDYGNLDLKFSNNTAYPVRIDVSVPSGAVIVNIYGTDDNNTKITLSHSTSNARSFPVSRVKDASVPAGAEVIKQRGVNGYTVTSYITITQNGQSNTKYLSTSVYSPMPEIINYNPNKPPPALIPPAAPSNPTAPAAESAPPPAADEPATNGE